MIRLTDEEIAKIRGENWRMSANDALCFDLIAKAQLKKVFEWGDEDCLEHPLRIPRRDCDSCWQSLLSEVK